MALKAGTVGLDPKYVDKNGAPISQDMPVDAYTKAETDVLLEAKADLTSLRANSKTFQFAYSGGKYGYKAGSTGDFHPFEEAGVTCMGWVKPADLSIGSAVLDSGIALDSGGYVIKDGVCYIDMLVHNTSQKSGTSITIISSGMPAVNKESGSASMLISGLRDTTRSAAEKYFSKINYGARVAQGSTAETSNVTLITTSSSSSVTVNANTYMHIWGQYEVLTT